MQTDRTWLCTKIITGQRAHKQTDQLVRECAEWGGSWVPAKIIQKTDVMPQTMQTEKQNCCSF